MIRKDNDTEQNANQSAKIRYKKKPGNCNILNFLHFYESINRTRPILCVEGAFDDPEE